MTRIYTLTKDELGRFRSAKRIPAAPDWKLLYEWREARRALAAQEEAARRDARVAPLRSIVLLALMSSVLVGMLVAGTLG